MKHHVVEIIRTAGKEEEKEGHKRVERVREGFYRRFNLPDYADAGKLDASTENSVLKISIPKKKWNKPGKSR